MYEQLEEWGIDDSKELAELILSSIGSSVNKSYSSIVSISFFSHKKYTN